jgi:hypothetical protein
VRVWIYLLYLLPMNLFACSPFPNTGHTSVQEKLLIKLPLVRVAFAVNQVNKNEKGHFKIILP